MKLVLKRASALAVVISLILSMITVSAEGEITNTPYAKHIIPGIINAVDFDYGGIGVACSDRFDVTSDFEYRDDVQLNFYDNPAGVVMAFKGGEWMKYTVTVEKTATYEISAIYATTTQNSNLVLTVDDTISESLTLEATGDWATFKTIPVGKISLEAGTHVLKFEMISGSATFRGLKFSELIEKNIITDFKKPDGAYRYVAAPAIIEAENFDMGPDGHFSTDNKNNGGIYRPDGGIDTVVQECGYGILLLPDEWTKYTFNVTNSGAYKVIVKGSGNGTVYFDDVAKGISFDTDDSGKAEVITVWLDKGEHSLKVKTDKNVLLDYIQLYTGSKDEAITLDELTDYVPPEYDIDESKVQINIYVSPNGDDSGDGTEGNPYLTMAKAKERAIAESANMTGNIVVHMLPGYYQLTETEIFDESCSGKNGYNIIFKGESETEPSIISGGTKISGWEPEEDGLIWSAPAPVEATRTLYVNGFPAQRAKSKYLYYAIENWEGEDQNDDPGTGRSDGFKVSATNFKADYAHPEELELVWPLYWTHQRTPVDDLFVDPEDSSKFIFKMSEPCWDYSRTKEFTGTNPLEYTIPSSIKRFYIENAKELLDEPGEFYFDKTNKRIYYYPFSQEDLTTAETYVGTTDFLIKLEGKDGDNRIKNLIFDNLAFRYGSWNVATTDGVIGTQTDHLANKIWNYVGSGGFSMPAQFSVDFASNIKILNCEFSCLGSSAIKMENGVSDSIVKGNVIRDISGTGIMVDSYEHKADLPSGRVRCDNIEISNNVIHRTANEFRGMTGISMYLPSNAVIAHNDMKRFPYSGIIGGWGWGGYDCLAAVNNQIINNKIEDVTSYVHDGAHIYTLDTLYKGVIGGNYLKTAGDYRGGIYLDSGSAKFAIDGNVVEDSTHWLFARTAVGIKEIVAENNFYDEKSIETVDWDNVAYANNTKVLRGDDETPDWPEEAQAIIDNAGLQTEYENLLDGVDIPSWKTDILDYQPTMLFASEEDLWVEAEDYIKGAGQDSGYHTAHGKEPVEYVDNYGTVIGTTAHGDWMMYYVTLNKSMEYNVKVRASNAFLETEPQSKVSIYVDNELVIDKAPINVTGHWDNYVEHDCGTAFIEAGTHSVKVLFVDNAFSFDKFGFFNDHYFDGEVYDEGMMEYQQSVFADIYGHWAEPEITALAADGIINGVSETEFAPDDTLSLYQAIWLASRTVGLQYPDGVCWKEIAIQNGLMKQDEADREITREEFAEVIINAYKIKKQLGDAEEISFPDASEISPEYLDAVRYASALGIVKGDENGYFNPKATLTRAEAAVMIERLQTAIS